MDDVKDARNKFKEALIAFMKWKPTIFVGGAAARWYGIRSTPSKDYDILIPRQMLQEMNKFLESQGVMFTGVSEEVYQYHLKDAKLPVDVICADNKLYQGALNSYFLTSKTGRNLKLVSPNYLAAMKVLAYEGRRDMEKKDRDAQDVISLLSPPRHMASEKAVRDILRDYDPSKLKVLDEILRRRR